MNHKNSIIESLINDQTGQEYMYRITICPDNKLKEMIKQNSTVCHYTISLNPNSEEIRKTLKPIQKFKVYKDQNSNEIEFSFNAQGDERAKPFKIIDEKIPFEGSRLQMPYTFFKDLDSECKLDIQIQKTFSLKSEDTAPIVYRETNLEIMVDSNNDQQRLEEQEQKYRKEIAKLERALGIQEADQANIKNETNYIKGEISRNVVDIDSYQTRNELAQENIADLRRANPQLREESQALEQKLRRANTKESEKQDILDQIEVNKEDLQKRFDSIHYVTDINNLLE